LKPIIIKIIELTQKNQSIQIFPKDPVDSTKPIITPPRRLICNRFFFKHHNIIKPKVDIKMYTLEEPPLLNPNPFGHGPSLFSQLKSKASIKDLPLTSKLISSQAAEKQNHS
jgi:hypothetical protein